MPTQGVKNKRNSTSGSEQLTPKQREMASPGKITQDDDELVGGETDISLTSALKEINKSIKDLTLSQDNFQLNIKAEIEKLKVAVNESIELKLQEFSVGLDMGLQDVNKCPHETLDTYRESKCTRCECGCTRGYTSACRNVKAN